VPAPASRFGAVASGLLGLVTASVIAGVLVAVAVTPAVALTGVAAKQGIGLFENLPSDLKIVPLEQKTEIYAKSGGKNVLLTSFYAQNRDVIGWSGVPATVKNATLAAEDVRFYEHGGVDPLGIVRATVSNALGDDLQGGSTITQQYVKNVCVQEAERLSTTKAVDAAYDECTDTSYTRKLKEIRLAIGLEKVYSKNDILLGYLNIAGFGGQVYGIEAASEYYYDEPAKDLDIGQAATLISIVNNPDAFRLDEKQNLVGAEGRRNYVLGVELAHKMITQADYDKYSTAKIVTKITPPSTGCQTAGTAGFFCDYVVKTILQSPEFGRTPAERLANLTTKGWRIYTTLDLSLQKKAQSAVDYYVPQTPGATDVGAASTSVQVGTGRVLTMVQNKTYSPTGAKNRTKYSAVNYNVNQTLGAGAGFQPGSTAKAFTLIGWLKSGHTINQEVNGNARSIPQSDFSSSCGGVGGAPWDLHNDENEKGNYTIQQGTAASINGVFASMAEEQDLCEIGNIADSMGVKNGFTGGKIEVAPTMAIGAASTVAPLDNAVAYATIANQGVRCDAIGIDEVLDTAGKSLPVPKADCRRVQDKQLIIAAGYDLHNPLHGTMSYDQLYDGKYMFGKTGTTDFAKDTWTMGSTTKVTTAVWVGNVTGDQNLRLVDSAHGCNAGNEYAVMRHCIFQAIMRPADAKYGGAASWPTPLPQYLYGGKAIVHQDAQPQHAASTPKKDKGGSKGSPTTGTPSKGTGPVGTGKGAGGTNGTPGGTPVKQ
jgi:membrane peptidoglycan carboxypeptidase